MDHIWADGEDLRTPFAIKVTVQNANSEARHTIIRSNGLPDGPIPFHSSMPESLYISDCE
jgi:hypothetical protein